MRNSPLSKTPPVGIMIMQTYTPFFLLSAVGWNLRDGDFFLFCYYYYYLVNRQLITYKICLLFQVLQDLQESNHNHNININNHTNNPPSQRRSRYVSFSSLLFSLYFLFHGTTIIRFTRTIIIKHGKYFFYSDTYSSCDIHLPSLHNIFTFIIFQYVYFFYLSFFFLLQPTKEKEEEMFEME